ncbi:MAG: sensor histidine kinase [Armatimonadota bacterium]
MVTNTTDRKKTKAQLLAEIEDLRDRLATFSGSGPVASDIMQHYQMMIDAHQDMITRSTFDGTVLFVNAAYCRMFGITPEEVLGTSYLTRTPQHEMASSLAALESLKCPPYHHTTEQFLPTTRGYRWIAWEESAIFNEHEEPIEVVAIGRDITPQKQAAEEIHALNAELEQRVTQRTRQLAESNSRIEAERTYLSSVIEILPIPVLIIDPASSFVRTNTAMVAFGEQHCLDLNKHPILLDADTRTPLSRDESPYALAIDGKATPFCECLLQLPNGRELPIIIHAAPVYLGEEIAAVVIAFQDISTVKEADRAKDQFLAVISHELLTPLTSILGWTQLAQGMQDEQITSRALTIIERNAQRQRRILDDLLDVSRLVHRKLCIEPEPADLWQLAEQSLQTMLESAEERRIAFTCHPPSAGLAVHVDPARIIQVISNLLSNAVKYSPEGSTVDLEGMRRGGCAVLTIRDTGRGIPPDLVDDLFNVFYQVERDERTGGMGVGLALVKGIVELHGGRVYASSAGLGQGSAFTIELPLAGG